MHFLPLGSKIRKEFQWVFWMNWRQHNLLPRFSDLYNIGVFFTKFIWSGIRACISTCRLIINVLHLFRKKEASFGYKNVVDVYVTTIKVALKVAFFRKCDSFFRSPNLKKKIFLKTILSLKFKFPANNSLLLLAEI